MKFRIAEIFGPTIQGEGRNVGMPCHFVRFGGCDFRCSWCDTPHAVLPEMVSKLPQMTSQEVYRAVMDLPRVGEWVVLTGGNPALFSLGPLIDTFHNSEWKVMLETQGSVFRDWFGKVDDLCFSPKPPSAGNITNLTTLKEIIRRTGEERIKLTGFGDPLPYLKVPVFTDSDLEYACEVHQQLSTLEMFISIGNQDPMLPTVGNPHPEYCVGLPLTRDIVLDDFRATLEGIFAKYPDLHDCRIFPQQHVLLWGNERGH